MKPTIEELLLQLLSTCLLIAQQGKWHAHFDYSPHVGRAFVWIYSADNSYQSPDSAPVARQEAKFHVRNFTEKFPEDEARQDLFDLLAFTQGFLSMEAAA